MDVATRLDEFRAEARVWLEANFPASLVGLSALALMDGGPAEGDLALWKQRMGAKGWGAPTWPAEYGGGGLTGAQARVLQQEMARLGAFNPLLAGMGTHDDRPNHPRLRHGRAKAPPYPADRAR